MNLALASRSFSGLLGMPPLGCLEKQARKEGQGEVCGGSRGKAGLRYTLGGATFLELGRRRPP